MAEATAPSPIDQGSGLTSTPLSARRSARPALPSASNVSLLAERFEAHGGRVARIILVSTALAFVSFSAAVAWLTGPLEGALIARLL